MQHPDFGALAATSDPPLDRLALALAAAFRQVDTEAALSELDRLGADLSEAAGGSPNDEAAAVGEILGRRRGFVGNRDQYDHPDNSMLDLVLASRTGLPILLSIIYVEAARRAGIPLAGVGLPGHFVVGHFGVDPPVLLDPFSRGRIVTAEVRSAGLHPWRPHETALRMLNNLVGSYRARSDIGNAILAARLRLALPVDEAGREVLTAELRGLESRMN